MPDQNTNKPAKEEIGDELSGTSSTDKRKESSTTVASDNRSETKILSGAKNNSHKSIERWTFGIGVLGMIAAISAATVYYCQLQQMIAQTNMLAVQSANASADSSNNTKRLDEQLTEMKGQVNASEKQAMAAQLSVNVMERQMRTQQRPWIRVELADDKAPTNGTGTTTLDLKVGEPLVYPLRLTNLGVTPASNIRISSNLFVVKEGEESKASCIKCSEEQLGVVETGTSYLFQSNPVVVWLPRVPAKPSNNVVVKLGLSEEEAEDLKRKTSYILIIGRVEYKDIFLINHWTNFCMNSYIDGTQVFSNVCNKYAGIDSN